MSDLAGLQSAIRQVPGVARASVRWPDPHGPAILRIEFASGADRFAVTETVAAQMAEVGQVDLSTIDVDQPFDPARRRLEFDSLSVQHGPGEADVEVAVALRDGDDRHVGRAADHGDLQGALRTAAEATIRALADRTGVPPYQIARVDHLRNAGTDQQVTVQVYDRNRTLLVGAALVRSSPVEAAARATLDAINRRLVTHQDAKEEATQPPR